MGANVRFEKNSLALLSSKRTKAFVRTRADEAFALPSFSEVAPTFTMESPYRSGGAVKLEQRSDDVERLKQTMLRHESMFKEQLYELHRLYQVQRVLMEESKSSASHPHTDSPSSNSSLLYNPDLCKPKEERRFWDANDASKGTSCKQLSFFPGHIDVNKPHEDRSYSERLANAACQKDSQRPVIDLEQPAEEHVEIETAEEKPRVRDTYLKTVGNSYIPHASWQALRSSPLSEKSADVRTYIEKNNSIHRESIGSTRRSHEDCFMPELSRHKEVPFFPLGPSKSRDCFAEEANPCPAQAIPITSLFGVSLNQEYDNSRDNQLPTVQSNLEENRKERKIFGIDAHHRSSGETSKLPHWLLQGSSTVSAKTSPVKNPAAQTSPWQHQTSPFLLQKQDERKADSFVDDRGCSISWPKSGTRLQFGESLLKAPQGKPYSGYFPDTSVGIVQGFHELSQASNGTDSTSHSKVERHIGVPPISATGYMSSPPVDRRSPVFGTRPAPTVFLPELSSKGAINGALMPPWLQQEISSPLKQQVSKAGIQNQRSLNAFSVNCLNAWGTTPASEEVQPRVFTKGPGDVAGDNRDIKGSSPSLFTRPEISSKRLIFGFMPTASDLELTLGLDTNVSGASETPKRVENSSLFEDVAQRRDKVVFDLNVQSGQDLDSCFPAESYVIPTESKQESETEKILKWQTPTGIKPAYFGECKTLHTSSNLKGIPEITTTSSTLIPIQSTNSSFTKVGIHREAANAECIHAPIANGGASVAGKNSDGSGLTSCESRNMSIPALAKARDYSNTSSGEACQSREVKISAQNECAAFSFDFPSMNIKERLSEEVSLMGGRRSGMLSAVLSCSKVFQGDTEKVLSVAKCTDVDKSEAAAENACTHVVETFEAADILLHLGHDMPSVVTVDHDADDEERALKWLADMIPQEEISSLDGGIAGLTVRESTLGGLQPPLESGGIQEKILDSFELSVLRLKPIDPDTEIVSAHFIERCDPGEECSPHPNLRRRSSRRGRVGRDFQKEMLPSIASLSRQEITEDLQIIEGLVKSATEAMARCSLSPKEDVSWSLPELSSVKSSGKPKGSRYSKAGKQNGLLRVCSWGESTRRRRMRRQRSQWMCLPPGV